MPIFSLWLMFGFFCADDAEWQRVRGLQYGALQKHGRLRPAVLAFACLAMLALMYPFVPTHLLLGWAATLALAWFHKVRLEVVLERQGADRISRRQFHHHAWTIGLCALIWAAPLILFERFLSETEILAIWTLLAMLIAGATASRTSVPMATMLFITITGGAAAITFLLRGDLIFALTSAGFSIITVLATLESARLFVAACTAEAGVAESREVVSLLLREFEEDEADWLWHTDAGRRVRTPSARFAYALEREPEDIEGKPFIRLIAGSSWETGQFSASLQDLAKRVKRQERFSNLLVQIEIGGRRRWWELSGTPTQDAAGNFAGYRGVGSDVTEQRESEERIAYLARYDTLTGLPNRLMLIEALSRALQEAKRWSGGCAFLMIDLDRFKTVNDTLGHPIGDRLLAQAAERLRGAMANNDHCGRLGGDEFSAVIYDVDDPLGVAVVAERVIEALSKPYLIDGNRVVIGASVGSAIGPRDGETVETLMRNADLALYQAKHRGRGGYIAFQPELQQDRDDRQAMESSLRHAAANNELHLRFQPVVNARNDRIVSFEALLRWTNPIYGSVSPAAFLPLAEETRLIVPIGEWVLREACGEAVRWDKDIRLSVNVSAAQLLDANFCAGVVAVLAQTGLPAQRLEFEVNERVFHADGPAVRGALESVLALGCSLALDDFGTGHSSLRHLRTMRFSTVKVDRSFVQGAARGRVESIAVIRAVVAMTQSLEIATVAEGVENIEEVRLMQQLGCDRIQGYHFGRPMDAAEAFSLVDHRRAEDIQFA